MKKLILLLVLLPLKLFSQYVTVPTHYDCEHAANHILKGHLPMFLSDSVKLVTEKKNERYVTDYGYPSDRVKSKVDKVFLKGRPEFISRTNGGYIFSIAVIDKNDDTKVINYVTFHVDAWTQKIVEIEILLGE